MWKVQRCQLTNDSQTTNDVMLTLTLKRSFAEKAVIVYLKDIIVIGLTKITYDVNDINQLFVCLKMR